MVGDHQVVGVAVGDQLGAQRSSKFYGPVWVMLVGPGISAVIGVGGGDSQGKAVALCPACDRSGDVCSASTNVQERVGAVVLQHRSQLMPVGVLPAGDDTVDHLELGVGAVQFGQITVGVVHPLGRVPVAVLQASHCGRAYGLVPTVVNSPVSTVSPGPKAMPQIRSAAREPGCSRICLSTNMTVALLMFPNLRSTSRDGRSWSASSSNLPSTLSRMLRPPGWIAQCSISRYGPSGSVSSPASSGVRASTICASIIFGT